MALLSLNENSRLSNSGNTPTGNIVGDLSAIFLTAVTDEATEKNAKRKTLEKNKLHDIRNCIIDMTCGDILY
jgi:hypothetical protein